MSAAGSAAFEGPVEAVETRQVAVTLDEVVGLGALVQVDEALAADVRLATEKGGLVQSVGRLRGGYALLVAELAAMRLLDAR